MRSETTEQPGDLDLAVDVVLADIPARIHPKDTDGFRGDVADKLAEGWTAEAIHAQLVADNNLARIHSGGGIKHAVRNLGAPPAPKPQRPERCGVCDETRHIQFIDDDGRPASIRCPNCHPLAQPVPEEVSA